MKIYRVEKEDKTGPYLGESSIWRNRPHYGKEHPCVSEEFSRKISRKFFKGKKWKCGFSSIARLKRWFNSTELKRLRKLGFKVVEVEAKKVHKGRVQLIFKGREKTRVVKMRELK